MHEVMDRVIRGVYKAKPVELLSFDQIREAQRLMETNLGPRLKGGPRPSMVSGL